jgi:hypothetical protein
MADADATRCSLQWKGTSICCDLRCECGHQSHIDSFFAYNVQCAGCGAVYRLPDRLDVVKVEPDDDALVAVAGQATDIAQTWSELRRTSPAPRDGQEDVPVRGDETVCIERGAESLADTTAEARMRVDDPVPAWLQRLHRRVRGRR